MAKYRNVHMSFWTDSKVADEFSPEDKYFYLYLLTNPLTTLTGCYEISKKQMSIDTGYSRETVDKLIERLDRVHGVIKYSPTTKEILILHWGKYNWTTSPKLRHCVEEQLKIIKDASFKNYVEGLFTGDTVSIPYQYGSDTSDSLVSDSLVSDTKKDDPAEKVNELFEELWKLYPRKEGKSSISKSKKLEIYKVGRDKMLKALELFNGEMKTRDKQYIPYGSTFFNTSYKDYIDKLEEAKSKYKPPKEEIIDPEEEARQKAWEEGFHDA